MARKPWCGWLCGCSYGGQERRCRAESQKVGPGLDQQVVYGVRGYARGSCRTTWRPGHCRGHEDLEGVESGPVCPCGPPRAPPVPRVTGSAAIRSAIMTVGMWVLADGMSGITDASATDRPSIPWTAPAASTTEPQPGAGPMAHVPTGW